jgi:hydroxymethylpyrimidine pyrophosphatase-like HAD family hydrolase
MDKKYFFFDIDGTLTDNATHQIVPSAAKALQQLQQNGHFVAIATGRAHYKAIAFANSINIHDLVCFGGGSLVKDDVVVCTTPLDDFSLLKPNNVTTINRPKTKIFFIIFLKK